jgi:phage anti-repressor protein
MDQHPRSLSPQTVLAQEGTVMTEQESTTIELMPFAQRPIGDQTTLTVNARDLYAYLELTGDYSLWIRRAIKRANLVENIDYWEEKSSAQGLKGGRPRCEVLLTSHAHDAIEIFYKAAPKKTICTYLYAIQQGDSQYIKIGIATDCKKRIQSLQSGNPFPLRFLGIWNIGSNAYTVEQSLHVLFHSSRFLNEWFCLSQKQKLQLMRTLKQYPRAIFPEWLKRSAQSASGWEDVG